MHKDLFPWKLAESEWPVVMSNGGGVNSMAMLVWMEQQGFRPKRILMADTGAEKPETWEYVLGPMADFLSRFGFPSIKVVRYQPQDYKNFPPYRTLEENCLTNGTLPSLAFGFKSCSQKWKIAPQDKELKEWGLAEKAWREGGKVMKLIGYDASPEDWRRRNHLGAQDDPLFGYRYPLQEAGWDREECKRQILSLGYPVPPKSSCFMCPAMKPSEIDELSPDLLRRIVRLEARAKPRLTDIEGLWRNGCKGTRGGVKKPGRISDYIRERGLLSENEVDAIEQNAFPDIVRYQEAHALGSDALSQLNDYRMGTSCPVG